MDRRPERARHETRRLLRHRRQRSQISRTAETERAEQGIVEPDGTYPQLARGSLDVPEGNASSRVSPKARLHVGPRPCVTCGTNDCRE